MNSKALHETFLSFLDEHDVGTIVFNNKTYFEKQKAISAIQSSVEETIKVGDIDERYSVLDIEKLNRYTAANKICFELFEKPSKIEFECYKNLSFATTTIACENFGFDIDNNIHKDKKRFQQFVELINFLHISAGVQPTEIVVNFTVNNVWRERR